MSSKSSSDIDIIVPSFDAWKETKSLIHLSLPSILVQICMFIVFPQAASSVGREFGSEALAGFSLGSLVSNLTCLSVMIGALTASDTLMPRAYGSGTYEQLGILLIQSIMTCLGLLALPVFFVLSNATLMHKILTEWLYQDDMASYLASIWIQVYVWGIPANLIFRSFQRFLVAQQEPWLPVFCAAIPAFIIQPFFVLPFMLKQYGFLGSAYTVVITQWCVILLLGLSFFMASFLRKHGSQENVKEGEESSSLSKFVYNISFYHPSSWPTMSSWKTACCDWNSLTKFWSLSFGGVLSLSEWWFWETMCFVAGSFGIEALCAHTIAYNMIPLLYMVPLGFSIGLTVRMGHILAAKSTRTSMEEEQNGENGVDPTLAISSSLSSVYIAKRVAAGCMCWIVGLGITVSVLMYIFRHSIIGLFISVDDHPLVVQTTLEIWPKVCIYIIILYLFGINSAIMKALGMQWKLATIIFVCLWCGLFFSVMYWAVYKHGGLNMEWTLIPTFYVIMQFIMMASYMSVDWYETVNNNNTTFDTHDDRKHNNDNNDDTNVNETTPLV